MIGGLKENRKSADSPEIRTLPRPLLVAVVAFQHSGESFMADSVALMSSSRRPLDFIGLVCLVLTLVLLSSGVQVAQAENSEETLRSVDPALVAGLSAPTPLPTGVKVQPAAEILPGTPAIEVQPGIIVLNTRGYNFGPPPGEIDIQAMRLEDRTRPVSPAQNTKAP